MNIGRPEDNLKRRFTPLDIPGILKNRRKLLSNSRINCLFAKKHAFIATASLEVKLSLDRGRGSEKE
jgi:hypothetical protein